MNSPRPGKRRVAGADAVRAMFDAAPDGVTLVAREGTLLQANPHALLLAGAASSDAIVGVPMLELIAPEHRQRWIEHHERVCMGETLRWEFELCGLAGTRRWVEAHGTPATVDGEGTHLSVLRDVSDRKHSDQQREQLLAAERAARTEAERVCTLKDEFLATLSHELRTPLNAILGFATLIRMAEMGPEELDAAVATIERNARQQAKLIDDLLDMNRIVSGKIRLDTHLLNLPGALDAAIEAARPAADEKSIRIETEFDRSTAVVRGDAARIRQVAWNLLHNAVKFTPPGGTVRVSLSRVSSHVEIAVSDNGEGIDPELLPHVFDRFRLAGASTTRKFGGLGLGLSIVKNLVELHGGSVRAMSPGKGRGATFIVALPVTSVYERAESSQAKERLPDPGEKRACTANLQGIAVLAVDDEPDAANLVKRVLEECRASVDTAGSVREALEHLQRRHFQILVSDIGMPVEDGYDLMQTVRSLEGTSGELRAIALTAFVQGEDRARAELAGFHAHLAKPVEASELIATVALLAGRQNDEGGRDAV